MTRCSISVVKKLIVLALVALFILGPERLHAALATFARTIRQIKNYTTTAIISRAADAARNLTNPRADAWPLQRPGRIRTWRDPRCIPIQRPPNTPSTADDWFAVHQRVHSRGCAHLVWEDKAMNDNGKNRGELPHRMRAQRENIDTFARQVRPRSVRLANVGIISSAIAAALAAGPALGGVSFVDAVQRVFSLSTESIVWRTLCLVAMLASFVAMISAQLGKSQDMAARLSAADACETELERL